jgi:hypothetical protein
VIQQPLIPPAMELELAKKNPMGQELSPEAQKLYELEGAKRFTERHPALRAINQEGGAA